MPEDGEYSYAGIEPNCGGWLAVMVDCGDTKRDQPKELAKWIRAGLTISRVLTEDIRSGKTPLCRCERRRKVRK